MPIIEGRMIMEDLRVKRTKSNIENAMMQLIDEKGFSNVRMTEIAERAMVNRNTIYLHYESKEEIVISLVDEAFKNSWNDMNIEELVKQKSTRKNLSAVYTKLFNTLGENLELYRMVLTDASLSGLLDKRILKIRNSFVKTLKPTMRNQIGIEYLVQGIYGVIKKWIIYDTGTIEENVKILTEFTFMNYRYLYLTR